MNTINKTADNRLTQVANVDQNDSTGFFWEACKETLVLFERGARKDPFRGSISIEMLGMVLSILVFLVSIIGNACIVLVVLRRKRMRTPTNIILVNLSIADILVASLCTIPRNLDLRSKRENAGLSRSETGITKFFICDLSNMMQQFSLLSSTFFLCIVAVERWIAAKSSVESRRHRPMSLWIKFAIGGGWLGSFLVSLPLAFISEMIGMIGDYNLEHIKTVLPYVKMCNSSASILNLHPLPSFRTKYYCGVQASRVHVIRIYFVVTSLFYFCAGAAMISAYGLIMCLFRRAGRLRRNLVDQDLSECTACMHLRTGATQISSTDSGGLTPNCAPLIPAGGVVRPDGNCGQGQQQACDGQCGDCSRYFCNQIHMNPLPIMGTMRGRDCHLTNLRDMCSCGKFASNYVSLMALRKRKKVIFLLFGMVVTYVLFSLPYVSIMLVQYYWMPESLMKNMDAHFISLALLTLTSAINPFFLFSLSKNFRAGLRSLLNCQKCADYNY